LLAILLCAGRCAAADGALAEAFVGAEKVDLRTCDVSSVVTLREKVGIPPPSTPVLVKVFERNALPAVLRPSFAQEGAAGVTINGKYIAIIKTELRDEYADILRHELVHAYITLASPAPLPLWFQEGSAVHYSMGKNRKFYGQAVKEQPGVVIGKTVELPESYKQQLQTFNYILDTVGEQQFNAWYKEAVMTGNVDPRPLLGLDSQTAQGSKRSGKRPTLWLLGVMGGILAVALVVAFIAARQNREYY
jgi:hypothetical protein